MQSARMRALRILRLRLRSLFRHRQTESELDEELRYHLERSVDQHLAAGMRPDDARAAALREFGPCEARKEECRDVRGLTLVDSAVQDVRYGLRALRKTPGFAAVAILSVALGVGANTTIFTILNAVLLRPLPYPEPARLVMLREQPLGQPGTVLVHPFNFLEWRARAQSLEALALAQLVPSNVAGLDGAEQIVTAMTTAELFPVLGLPFELGRGFTADETRMAGRSQAGLPVDQPVAILGHAYWMRQFASDPAVVGKTILLDGRTRTILGVAPAAARLGTTQPDLYVPLAIDPDTPQSVGSRSFLCLGRLKRGVGIEAAQAELTTISADLARRHPLDQGYGVAVLGLHEYLVREGRPALRVLMAVVATVLVIACVNLAGLLMARGIGRRSELALRASLGASRLRLVRQLVIESLVLSVLGGVAGLLLASWATRALVALAEGALTLGRTEPIRLDATCLVFTMGLTTLTALAFGLLPSWQASRVDPQLALSQHGRSGTPDRRHQRWRAGLVVAEVAMAMVLLVGAGLLLRSFSSLVRVDLGFEPGHSVTMGLFLGVVDAPRRAALVEDILQRVEALPGVRAAGTIQFLPLAGTNCGTGVWLDAQAAGDPARTVPADCSLISRGYLAAMGVPVLEGRPFDRGDRMSSPRVVMVNRTFARRYLPGGGVLGRHLVVQWSNQAPAEIVGVVADVRHNGLTSEPVPTVFLLHAQTPGYVTNLVARTTGDPAAQAATIRRAIQAVDTRQAVSNVRTMAQYLDAALARPRLYAVLVAAFAALALTLAAIGVYGLMAFVVGQRTHEIGIRMALGAGRRTIFNGVFRQGAVLLLGGVVAGIGAALLLQQLVATLLFGVTTTDGVTYAAAVVVFAVVVLAAASVPAWRASRVDPMRALR